jgi:MarR family transcriptional regulator, organic hydroperoxide resistance regulator
VRRTGSRARVVAASNGAKMPALGEVLEFMRLIWGISHGLQSTSKRMEAELGVTGAQRLVVRIVGRCPGASAGQIAEILRLHPSTLTGVLRRLQKRGLVTRRAGEQDRREVHLHLTAAGRAMDRRHAGTVEAAVRRALEDLNPRQTAVTAHVLRALENALSNDQPRRRGTHQPATRR